ncbi:hypothetical protein C2E23DRAFT_10919 [Lenzites betulinus]|nr:hypothetical protein C2E23DRAFT_10919 [Lenzites betulinus]
MSEPLPPEIIDRILDYLHNDSQTLATCARTSHVMLPTSRYHRFRDIKLFPRQVPALLSLIDSAPDFARAITSVLVRFTDWTDPEQVLAFLSRLPALSSFGMIVPAYQRVSVEHLAVVASKAPALTSLVLCGPGLITAPLLLSGLSMFRALNELSLQAIDVVFPSEDVPYNLEPPPHLRRLKSQESDGAPLISHWLETHPTTSGLQYLQHTVVDPRDAMQLCGMATTCANTVKHLEVVFIPEGRMADALRDSDFSLSPFQALESCTLRFAFGEMCVAQNESLKSIPTIVSQLTAPSLRTITVALVVDNIEDLRSLNSECAVRNLSPAYFEDMRVLDWELIAKALAGAGEGPESTRRFVLEGQGDKRTLDSHIRECCPTLYSLGLVSLVNAQKEDRWW